MLFPRFFQVGIMLELRGGRRLTGDSIHLQKRTSSVIGHNCHSIDTASKGRWRGTLYAPPKHRFTMSLNPSSAHGD